MGGELQDLFTKVSKELEGSLESTGLKSAHSIVGTLSGIQDQVGQGDHTVKPLEQLLQAVNGFQIALKEAVTTSSGATPGGSCFVACASWYTGRVTAKLGKVKAESSEITTLLTSLVDRLRHLVSQLSDALSKAVPVIQCDIQELISLPANLTAIARQLEHGGMEAIAKVDLTPVKAGLDLSPTVSALGALVFMKQDIGPAVLEARGGVGRLADFVAAAPAQVRAAFDVVPCLPMQAVAPPVMQDLLSRLEALRAVDLAPLLGMLCQAEQGIDNFDAEQVRQALASFSEKAREKSAVLVEAVEAASGAAQMENSVKEGIGAIQGGDFAGGMKKLGGLVGGIF